MTLIPNFHENQFTFEEFWGKTLFSLNNYDFVKLTTTFTFLALFMYLLMLETTNV